MSNIGNSMHMNKYVYDFAEDGGAVGAISLSSKANSQSLPDNAIVESVVAFFESAIVGSSSTLSWGNTTDPDGYSGAAIAEATLVADYVANGYDNASALLWDDTNDHIIHFLCNSADDRDFSVTIGTAPLTAGKVHFFVKYYLP